MAMQSGTPIVRLTSIDLAIFALYMLVVIGLGVYASRKAAATKRDYFLAGDKLPWWMIGGSIVAANISSHHFIGVIGTANLLPRGSFSYPAEAHISIHVGPPIATAGCTMREARALARTLREAVREAKQQALAAL